MCLWDTGAQISLISERLAKKLKAELRQIDGENKIKISGIGQGAIIPQFSTQISVRFQDRVSRPVHLYVCQTVPHDLLLGLDFMTAQNIGFIPCGTTDSNVIKLIHNNKEIANNQRFSESQQVYVSEVCPKVNLVHREKKSEGKGTLPDPVVAKAFSAKLLDPDLDNMIRRLQAANCELEQESLEYLMKLNSTNPHCDVRMKQCCTVAAHSESATCDCNIPPKVTEDSFAQKDGPENKIDLSPEQQAKFDKLLEEYADVFAETRSDVGKANREEVTIKLKCKDPINVPNYRTPLKYRDWLKNELNHLQKAGIIETSDSAWNSPALVVPKKLDNNNDVKDQNRSEGKRLVVDYRKLNEVIENRNFPMPRVQDIITKYQGKKVFSVLDIRHAYYTIKLDPESMKVTAFSCEFGKFHFCFLPQGLKISPAIFQQTISTVLAHLEHSDPYLDDISTASEDCDQHIEDLRDVFQAMRDSGFKLKKSKCCFFRRGVLYLGHWVSDKGVMIDPDKIRDVDKMTLPKTVGDARSLVGYTNFLREHVPYFADLIDPIQQLISDGKGCASTNIEKFHTKKHQAALDILKKLLKDNQILAYPDPTKPFELYTDASKKFLSGILMQEDRPISYFSRGFKGSQLDWSALVKEAFAVYRAVENFAVFITGSLVKLKCDHKPLKSFLKEKTKNSMVNRWSLNIQQHDIEFEWVPTDKNPSDYLSRMIDEGIHEPHDSVEDEFTESNKGLSSLITKSVNPLNITELDIPKPLQKMDMVRLQSEDPYCKRLRKQMAHDEKLNDQFHEDQGVLYKVVELKGKIHFALVLPPKLGLTAIVNTHLELQHPGEKKMTSTLQQRVYWRNMTKEIKRYVAGCRYCQIKTLKQHSYSYLHDMPPLRKFDRLAVDLSWGYSQSKDGNVAVLTAICLLSQYPFAEPIRDRTSASVAKAFGKILAVATNCQEVLSDNGKEFVGSEFQALLKAKRITHTLTAPYSPQSNAVKERWHRYMNEVVRLSRKTMDQNTWEDAVQAAIHAYRVLPHTATGESPHFLVFGEDPVISIDTIFPTLRRSYGDQSGAMVLEQLRIAYGLAHKNTCLARRRGINNKVTLPDRPLKVGDLVLIKDHQAAKSESPWKDGYRIIKFTGTRTVQVEHTQSGHKARVALQHLRRSEPLAILLNNSSLDLFPGRCKLYLTYDQLADLNWPDIVLTNTLDEQAQPQADQENVEHDHGYSRPSVPKQDPPDQVPKSKEKKAAAKRNERRFDEPYRPRRNVKSTQRPDEFVYISEALVHSCDLETVPNIYVFQAGERLQNN